MKWPQRVTVKQLMLKSLDGAKMKLLLMSAHTKTKMEKKLKSGLTEMTELDHKLLLRLCPN